jgi:hypothetical protein
VGIFDSSLVPFEEREAEFKPVLAAIIDPLTNICTLSATRLGMSNMAVFMINCLSVMQVNKEKNSFVLIIPERFGSL